MIVLPEIIDVREGQAHECTVVLLRHNQWTKTLLRISIHGASRIDVAGCISAQPPWPWSRTYDPVTVTWEPTGGILIFWWKFAHAAIASGCVTGFWHIGSRTRSPNWPFTLAVFIILTNSESTINRIWKSPSFSTLMPVTVLHRSKICSLAGCKHDPKVSPMISD